MNGTTPATTRDRPTGRRNLRRAPVLVALFVAGCATHVGFDESSPRQVLAVGIENIAERYIDPVDAGAITLAGLSRLSAFDETFAVRRVDGTVQIAVAGIARAEHSAPAGDDPYGWAWLAADLVDEARRSSPAIGRLSNDSVYKAVFEGTLAGFDRYSRYTTPEAARRNRAARDGFGGLGISIAQNDDGVIVVTQVHRDAPAARAGFKVDDRITHVDGTPVTGMALADAVGLLRGELGDPVTVRIERDAAARPIEVTVRRAHIVLPTVAARRHGGLLEIKLSGFNHGTARALRRELDRARREMGNALKGIILDLRGNPGGLLDQAVAAADLFLPQGRILSTRGRHTESNQIFDAQPDEHARNLPLAVLINGRSASAAEIVAVALRDSRRAVVIGSTSFGKGTVQTIARLPNGGEMTLTWARMMAPSGHTLDHQGIVPALCTGGSARRAAALLGALAATDGTAMKLPQELLRPQAGAPHYTREGHDACPPSSSESPADIEAARIVLGNRAVYAQAVSEIPAIAARR